MTGNDDGKGASRFQRQLELMGLGDGGVPEGELAEDRRLLADARPKPLDFADRRPTRRIPPQVWPALGALAAAGLVFVVWKRPPAAPFQTMGGDQIAVFAESNGTVRPLTPGIALTAGTRLKAEVLAGAPSTAFWGVVARDGRALSDAAWIAANRLQVPAGERRSFKGSLELDGPSEGEVLVVVLCPEAAHADPAAVARTLGDAEAPAGCRREQFVLRP